MLKIYLIISLSFFIAVAQQEKQLTINDIDFNELKFDFDFDLLNSESKNIFITLLPLYGPAKLSKLITQQNINDIKVKFSFPDSSWFVFSEK